MKRPIAWHKSCLHNLQNAVIRAKLEATWYVEHAERLAKDAIAYDAKIIEAEARGLDGFDIDRFGKKRGDK